MFGVSFAFMKTLVKRIKVDQDLAFALWDTGNFDARLLALKISDPAQVSPKDLDRWAEVSNIRSCGPYLPHLVAEGPHARAKAEQWLASRSANQRLAAWGVVAAMAMLDEATPDVWFEKRLEEIEKTIHTAPNLIREAMNGAVISIGCRNAALRKKAAAAAKRIGKVDIDHGDTSCKTPDAGAYIDKAWGHSTSKGFESPAAHERSRESMRTRC
jgi:3-methyladenine DNA glycosylase AlkD